MIFVSGVHGVGKTYFCNQVKETTGILTYSASELISNRKNEPLLRSKLVQNICNNQKHLLDAINDLRKTGMNYILDGHFCLLDSKGKVERIPYETFDLLQPEVIVLLTEAPELIARRRKERDGFDASLESIAEFQHEEVEYAKEVSQRLGSKLFVSNGLEDFSNALLFVESL